MKDEWQVWIRIWYISILMSWEIKNRLKTGSTPPLSSFQVRPPALRSKKNPQIFSASCSVLSRDACVMHAWCMRGCSLSSFTHSHTNTHTASYFLTETDLNNVLLLSSLSLCLTFSSWSPFPFSSLSFSRSNFDRPQVTLSLCIQTDDLVYA